jgi:hypothetical protein
MIYSAQMVGMERSWTGVCAIPRGPTGRTKREVHLISVGQACCLAIFPLTALSSLQSRVTTFRQQQHSEEIQIPLTMSAYRRVLMISFLVRSTRR